MGYVYILDNDSMPGLLKIGKTVRNSRERAKELSHSTSVPTPFRVVFELSSDKYEILEREAHSRLARYRVGNNREFFKCTLGIAIKVLKEVYSEHLKATDRSLSDNLYGKLKSRDQRIKDGAVSKLFSHLEVNPNSIRRMLLPLIYIVESDNWSYDSSTKLNAIELLKGIQLDLTAAAHLVDSIPTDLELTKLKGIQLDLRTARALIIYDEQRRIEQDREKELGNNKKIYVSCPTRSCRHKVQIPAKKNQLDIICPKCNTIFEYDRGKIIY